MENLIFPSFDYKVKKMNGKPHIYDIIRRKYILLTPEEWVRQHLVHYMINELKYPKALISVEEGLQVNRMQKRSDVLVFDRLGNVFMVIECKSFKVKLQQNAMVQLSNYNQKYSASYIALTNGNKLYVYKMDYQQKKSELLEDFPAFK